MKKTKLILLALSLCATGLYAQTVSPCVVVQQKDGTSTEYLLTEEPRISYKSDVVTLTWSAGALELAPTDIERVYLSTTETGDQTTKITSVEKSRIALTADGISLSGLQPGSSVAVYSTNGQCIASEHVADNGQIDMSLPAGILVIKTQKQTFKIIRK